MSNIPYYLHTFQTNIGIPYYLHTHTHSLTLAFTCTLAFTRTHLYTPVPTHALTYFHASTHSNAPPPHTHSHNPHAYALTWATHPLVIQNTNVYLFIIHVVRRFKMKKKTQDSRQLHAPVSVKTGRCVQRVFLRHSPLPRE